MIARCYLTYNEGFSRPNQFIWLAKLESIRARIQLASAAEIAPVDIHLRFRRLAKALHLVFCRPLDEATFLLESAIVHRDLPRMQIVLVSVPEHIAQQIRAL